MLSLRIRRDARFIASHASWIAAVIFGCPAQTSAQGAPAAHGMIDGIAIDSIRGGVLRDAVILLSGTSFSAVTDSAGQFRMRNLPPGLHTLEVIHPLLDTFGIALRTQPLQLKSNDSTFLVISTPSASYLVERRCSVDERKLGPAMALGKVFDAGSGKPAAGANVIVKWTDYQVERKSISRSPQRRSAIVQSDGSFRICGMPSDLAGGIVASRQGDTTATLRADFASGLVIVGFQLAPVVVNASESAPGAGTPAPGQFKSGASPVRGRVVDANGSAVEGARISTENEAQVTLSAADGSFELSGLRPGTRALVIRRLGFEPVTLPVEVGGVIPKLVDVRLTKYVPVLETMRVSAIRDRGLERVGFAARSKSGAGRFLSPDQLDRRNSPALIDLLASMPSLRSSTNPNGQRLVTGRFGECVRYFVDGHRWMDSDDPRDGPDNFLSGSQLGAIEVYGPNFAPAEFITYSGRGQPCTAVVVWTRWKLQT